jgi:hypothetical protein
MKLLKAFQTNSSGQICQNCAHFQNNPALIEEIYSGLTAMSSGFASVRDKDGICDHHRLYLSARDGCRDFTPHTRVDITKTPD